MEIVSVCLFICLFTSLLIHLSSRLFVSQSDHLCSRRGKCNLTSGFLEGCYFSHQMGGSSGVFWQCTFWNEWFKSVSKAQQQRATGTDIATRSALQNDREGQRRRSVEREWVRHTYFHHIMASLWAAIGKVPLWKYPRYTQTGRINGFGMISSAVYVFQLIMCVPNW